MKTGTDLFSAGRWVGCVAVVAMSAGLGNAAEPAVEQPNTGPAVNVGKAVAVRVVDLDLRSLPKIGAAESARSDTDLTPAGAIAAAGAVDEPVDFEDSLVSEQRRATSKAAGGLTVDVSVSGIGFTGATPADPVGEAGGGYFVQTANAPGGAVFAVYETASGDMVAGPSKLGGLWQGAGACAEGWGHAGVVYDSPADRWVLSELGAGNHLCVFVSQSGNPVTGGWFAYDFALPKFPDFARLGVWQDGYYVATNEDRPAVYAFERSAMLAGGAAAWQRFTVSALEGFGFQSLAPVDIDGVNPPPPGTGGLFVRHADGQAHGGADRLELYELDVDWSSPPNSSLAGPTVLATAPFDSSLCGLAVRGCVPQPDTAVRLDPVREVVMGAVRYRRFDTHESLVGNFTVDTASSNHAGVRWFELRRNNGSWTLYQEGTYSPDERHRWIGSAALDGDGNLALVFNMSDGSSTYPSMAMTGRAAADTPGVMTVAEEILRAGTGSQTAGHSPQLWGASNSLSVDPDDDCTFWATAAVAEDGAWNTHIASFRFPSCTEVAEDMIFSDGVETGNLTMWSSWTQ